MISTVPLMALILKRPVEISVNLDFDYIDLQPLSHLQSVLSQSLVCLSLSILVTGYYIFLSICMNLIYVQSLIFENFVWKEKRGNHPLTISEFLRVFPFCRKHPNFKSLDILDPDLSIAVLCNNPCQWSVCRGWLIRL